MPAAARCHETERLTAAALQLCLGLDNSHVTCAWEAGMARGPPDEPERKEPVSPAVQVLRQNLFKPVLSCPTV